ncbi:GNAT family N-acetyltransferase [Thalassobacillus sp. CUG 92003]|uniref:GNAT family N-acetyltransferase n=1 Tax=Thalassobacillus sp. CUG 92003 TaxID=2736641 RepID=UPI0015E78F81|nr:GNAT family N-acetyltransferase [Thalassobacillus sp. CUG 92003]
MKWITNTLEWADTEQDIMNSHPAYNQMAKDKETLDYNDIVEEFEENEALGGKRYLISKDDRIIALLDYCPEHPVDHRVWLGLLIVHAAEQGKGYGREIYMEFEDFVKATYAAEELRLAVLTENKNGRLFWDELGFEAYREAEVKGKPVTCLRKPMR